MRIGIFARRLAPYTVSFLAALARRGHRLELIHDPAAGEAPFQDFDLGFCDSALADGDDRHRRDWLRRADRELPDAAWIAGWVHPLERQAGRRLRRLGRPVVCGLDNPWRGDLRQWAGVLAAPFWLRPFTDRAWVAGAPQEKLARRLGFGRIARGLYCADVAAYRHDRPWSEREPALLFSGRLIADKGVDLLIAAYRDYRGKVAQPLELWLAGTGPLAALAVGEPGVRLLGFVQPAALPGWMARCQALVLPSRVENWGVVIQEAAVAGLPVLASEACGAATAFVEHRRSGLLYRPELAAITGALLAFHSMGQKDRQQLSRQSRDLGLTWTPERQVDDFESLIGEI